MTLTPAYGRDYKSGIAVRIALAEGKDFIVNDPRSPWDGKPVNLPQLRADRAGIVTVRYAALRKTLRVDTSKNIE